MTLADGNDRAPKTLPATRVVESTAELEVALSNLQALHTQRTQTEMALRESEERYRRLVDLSPESVVVIADNEIVYINTAGVRLFGAVDADDILHRRAIELIQPHDRVRAVSGLLRLASAGEVATQAEFRLLRLDGTEIESEITAAGVMFDGQPAVQVLVRDVTERKAMERMKDELLSIVSHELRTPLTSLRGSLGLLAGGVLGPLPARGQRMLDVAVNNADRLIRLLNDVLDLERMRAGRLTLEFRACVVGDLVEQAVAEMRGLAERTGVELCIGQVDGIVAADPDRIVQVLTNLLSNAVKFSADGGKVLLSATVRGDRVRLCVADEGRGIPIDQLESIFGRFQQVDTSDSRIKGGAGLGLAICRTMVEQHGGRVWAESLLGYGSTFYVELNSAEALAAAA
jgi:PAS domain S-box-containing protein